MDKGNQKNFQDLCREGKIVIPIIQRDYAQGREGQEELRENFLKEIQAYLESDNEHELDFIYGTLKNGVYTILDGQQRLTTLFLLYWYFSWKEDRLLEFQKEFREKFSYETRATTSDFCKALTSNIVPKSISFASEEKLSALIRNEAWYLSPWNYDPTIRAMLLMLDDIHGVFHLTEKKYYDKLSINLKFQFLNLEDFNLTDDLYIKMNATGIQLTPFENFKASLELHMKQKGYEKSFQEKFAEKIDTTWLEFFWNFGERADTDALFMRFFHTVLTGEYYSKEENSDFSDFIRRQEKESMPLSCSKYVLSEVITEECLKKMTTFLDIMANNIPECDFYLAKNTLKSLLKQGNSPSYTERLQFYAYYLFLCSGKSLDHLNDWMRLIVNLTENTRNDDISDFARDIKAIKGLAPYADGILEYIRDNEIKGFSKEAKDEEILKAKLLLTSKDWQQILYTADIHPYFKGQISFLLRSSNAEESLGSSSPAQYQNTLQRHYALACGIFNDKGLQIFPDYLWERALLSKGNYLLQVDWNESFCTNIDRDTSWKRCLQANRDEIISWIFQELDHIKETENILLVEALLKIIATRPQIDDWREQFIQHPDLFEHDSVEKSVNRYVRFENNTLYLLSKSQMNSWHTELYSLLYYLKNKDKNYLFFEWLDYAWSTSWAPPFACLKWTKDENYTAQIYYSMDNNQQYSVWFGSDAVEENPYGDNLKESGLFSTDDPTWYKKLCCSEEEVSEAIKSLAALLPK